MEIRIKWFAGALSFVFFVWMAWADVKSTSSELKFDVNADGQAEMVLKSEGLGVGKNSPQEKLDVAGNAVITESLSIGGGALGGSNLHLSGTLGMSVLSVSSNTVLEDVSVVMVDTSSDNILISLPYAGNVSGRKVTIKKVNSDHEVDVVADDSYIDGKIKITLESGTPLPSLDLISNGTDWYILHETGANTLDVASDNLVAWYKLDEPAGSSLAFDEISQTYNAGIVDVPSANIGVQGKMAEAIFFNGNGQIKLPNFGMSTTQGSFAMWINYSSDFGSEIAMLIHASDSGSGDGFGGQNELHVNLGASTQNPQFFVEAASDDIRALSSVTVGANAWHHIVGTWDSTTTGRIYQNGVETGSEVDGPATFNFGSNIILGRPPSDKRKYEGLMDEVRVYNKALSAEEVKALFESSP